MIYVILWTVLAILVATALSMFLSGMIVASSEEMIEDSVIERYSRFTSKIDHWIIEANKWYKKFVDDTKSQLGNLSRDITNIDRKLENFKREIGNNGVVNSIDVLSKMIGSSKIPTMSRYFGILNFGNPETIEHAPSATILERLDKIEEYLKIKYVKETKTFEGYKKDNSKE